MKGEEVLKSKSYNLNLFFLKGKNLAFKKYLVEGLEFKYELQINKDFLVSNENLTLDSGKIFVIEEAIRDPIWMDVINNLKRGDNKIKLEARYNWIALVFLRFKEANETILMTFGRTSGILIEEYIIKNFGIDTAKQIVNSQNLKHIKIQSFDDRQTKIQKGSIKSLNENHLIDPFKLNSIYDFSGNVQIAELQVSAGGEDNLRIKGSLNMKKDLLSLIDSIISSYKDRESTEPQFKVKGNINSIIDLSIQERLNRSLYSKLERLFNQNKINGNSTRNLYINPNKDIDHDKFLGYKFTSIGIPTKKIFNENELDSIYIFERIKKSLSTTTDGYINISSILHKLNNIKVHLIYEDESLNETIGFFNSLYFEMEKNFVKYIFLNGKWYEIDTIFYDLINRKIEELSTKAVLTYIPYNTAEHKDENHYNAQLAKESNALELDCTRYRPSKDVRKMAKISPQSNVELADILNYNSDNQTLQFIHIKKLNGQASQTIHSFTQAKSSAQIFAYDQAHARKFINEQRRDHGFSEINFNKIKNVEIIIALILPSSKIHIKEPLKLFSILERISLYETINILYPLGFKFKLNFIKSNII